MIQPAFHKFWPNIQGSNTFKRCVIDEVFRNFIIVLLLFLVAQKTSSQTVYIHVSPLGDDQANGMIDQPVQTLGRAIEMLKMNVNSRANDSIYLILHEGIYRIEEGIQLSQIRRNRKSPIVIKGVKGDKVVISGGKTLTKFRKLAQSPYLKEYNQDLAEQIIEIDLLESGINAIDRIRLSGFNGNNEPRPYTFNELYFNESPMPLSRWPNEGYALFNKVKYNAKGEVGLVFKEPIMSNWVNEKNVILHGYWKHLWADAYEHVSKFDLSKQTIWLLPPYNHYKFGDGMPFAVYNVIREIDSPGEWAFDPEQQKIYFFPPGQVEEEALELAICETPLLNLENSAWITIENITFEKGAAEGITIKNSNHISLANCQIKSCARDGLLLLGGSHNTVSGCKISDMGRGGIKIDAGDRETLEPGNVLIENCHIHDLSRIDRTYTPGIWVDGVGTHIRNCKIHDVFSSAMRINGNDHLVEYNELFRVVTESDDQGAIDMWGDPTFRGNVFRYNYIYDVGPLEADKINAHTGRAGIRFDDAISGNMVYGNIFRNCSLGKFGAVQIHGGKENLIWNNIFYQCTTAISFTPWPREFWLKYTKRSLGVLQRNRLLYLTKYPDLVRLDEDLNVNSVVNNYILNCGQATLRMPDEVIFESNFEFDNAPEISPEDKSLNALEELLPMDDDILFEAIPFDEIGMSIQE